MKTIHKCFKVAFVGSDTIPSPASPNTSRAVVHCNLASYLSDLYDMHIYAPKLNSKSDVCQYQGVTYHYIADSRFDNLTRFLITGLLRKMPKSTEIFAKKPFFESLINDFIYAIRVAKNIKLDKIDIVQISEETRFIKIIKFFNPTAKVIISMHSELLSQLDRPLISNRISRVDSIVGCSMFVSNKIKSCHPSLSNKCYTIYNGVDLAKFKTKQKKLSHKILYVSRVSPEKGLHILIEALSEVVKKFPDTHLDIIGQKQMLSAEFLLNLCDEKKVQDLRKFYKNKNRESYLNYLSEQITELCLSSNVTFYGAVPHDNLVNYYQEADLFVLPSFSETFGMGLIEAMACGVPVIASNVGGMPEVVENRLTGLIVESGDSQALAKAIIDVFSNEQLRCELSVKGRERVEKLFSWEKIANDSSKIYASLKIER